VWGAHIHDKASLIPYYSGGLSFILQGFIGKVATLVGLPVGMVVPSPSNFYSGTYREKAFDCGIIAV